MKKTICKLMSLALLVGTLPTAGLAVEPVESEDFIWNHASYTQMEDGEGYYESEDYCTLTTTKDLYWVNLYYYNAATSSFELTSPMALTGEGDTVVDVDGSICIGSTKEVMDYYEWVAAMDAGTVTYEDEPYFMEGTTFTVHGEFYFVFEAMESAEDAEQYHIMNMNTDGIDTYSTYLQSLGDNAPAVAPTGVATATASTVTVDGKVVDFEAYFINDNNYFKLRDIAAVLSGSGKQFEVEWDEDAQSIALTSGRAYTPVGGELALGDGSAKMYLATTASVYLDGEKVELVAYNIGGNNYFKLRDLGEAFDFDVTWDSATRGIVVDTAAGYTLD